MSDLLERVPADMAAWLTAMRERFGEGVRLRYVSAPGVELGRAEHWHDIQCPAAPPLMGSDVHG